MKANVPTHTVFACEPQPIVIEGLARVLEHCEDLRCVGSAASPPEAMAHVRQLSPDVVLIDQSPGLRAVLQFITDLRNEAPSAAPVLWVTDLADIETFRALQLGVRGVVRKTRPVSTLLECLRGVLEGRVWVEETEADHAHRFLARKPGPRLTPRERDIIRLVARGMKNREIGLELNITPGTVKVHLMHIFEKTGVKDRFDLAVNGRRLLGPEFETAEPAKPGATQAPGGDR
ncbi:MAG: response regulator transcription factor [Bryobacteraceae bacterium]|nr:response regulator transcription factor [Bryobacteraceae bacterium]